MTVALTHLHEHKGCSPRYGRRSDLVCADATGRNPNFAWYTGWVLARASGIFVTPDDRFLVVPIRVYCRPATATPGLAV